VNGARLAPTSTIGDFVDVSLIPVTAIERIEVLSDGASSIYGGDAVAGVVNLILRGDFEGSETAVRYGSVTEGSLDEVRLSQTLGKSWSGGNLMGTYEYFARDSLRLSDRPEIAAPTLLNGGPITVSDSIDLLPEQERHSFVLSGSQSLSERLQVSSTALYSKREVTTLGVGIANTTTVSKYKSSSESVTANIVADYELNARSSLSFDAGYSQVRNDDFQQQFSPSSGPQIFDQTESSLWSVGLLANSELFNLPAGALQAAVGGQFRHEAFQTQQIGSAVLRDGSRDVSALFAEINIPLVSEDNAMPGIHRLELNLSGRFDDYSDFGTTTNPKVGLLWAPVDGVRLRSSYSTSFAPPKLGQSGALDRGVGVLPYDVVRRVLNIPLPDPSLAGVNYLITSGTADDLDPETSRTFTAGFDINRSAAGHDLSISGNYYDISFEDRLGTTPVPGNLNANFAPGLAFNDPSLFPDGTVVFFPTSEQIAAVLASLNRPVTFAAGATAIENIGFINNVSLTRNLASTKTRGLDLEIAYGMDADVGRLTAKLNANYILDFTQQASETTPSVETLNTLYNPVDLQLRGQLGLSRGGFSGAVVFNYVDRYQTDGTSTARPIRSWSTVDLNLAYRFEDGAPDWLKGTSIGLSALNLFDKAPPPTPPQTSFAIAGYDPANANPLGRFIAVDLRKSF
jgi:outer membrane receptor protein involved in Fe transport